MKKTSNRRDGRKHGWSLSRGERATAYLFLTPAVFFLLLLIAWPLLEVIWNSFNRSNLINPSVKGFAGLENYRYVFTVEYFTQAMYNTVIWTVLSVAGEYVMGLISALALNQPIKGRAIFRGIIVIPWVVPIVVAGMTWTWLLTPDYGIINIWMVKLGIMKEKYYWLGEMNTALLTVTFVNIWRSFPFYTVSLLAGMQSISKEMLEAAAIDGAGMWKRFRHIVMPQLKTVSITIIVMHIIWSSINFDFIWIMTQGGPLHSSETLPILIYRLAMKEYNYGAASALSTFMMSIMIVFTVIYFLYTRQQKANVE
jgi:multiple sugar transport system permease protein